LLRASGWFGLLDRHRLFAEPALPRCCGGIKTHSSVDQLNALSGKSWNALEVSEGEDDEWTILFHVQLLEAGWFEGRFDY
jgi:hypothetical protein